MSIRGQRGPGEGGLGAHALLSQILQIRQELSEELLGSLELVAKGTAHGQVVDEDFAEGAHATPPGQGRAIVRRASRSTLA